ncbi:hypothetical protein BDQ17DRAFT_1050507 [Cyathus striatus]|nr:hypothetical protein BDQ17DRAFT_1050507 [Cyathus striatus]
MPHTSISKLVPDVLIEIFQYLLPSDIEQNPHRPSAYHYADIMAASHVFQYFRDVMLTCPTLWSSIIDTGTSVQANKAQVTTMLERSKSALTLDVHVTHAECLHRLEPEVYRIRSFFLYTNVYDSYLSADAFIGMQEWLHAYQKITCNPAPQLKVAHIASATMDYWPALNEPSLPFFKVCLPKLCSLTLEKHSVDFKTINLKSLQYLRTIDVPMDSSMELLSIISEMPNLRSLSIFSNKPLTNYDMLDEILPKKPVSLPHFQLLDIRGPITFCSDFISRFHTSPTTEVHLECNGAFRSARAFFEPIAQFISDKLMETPVLYETAHFNYEKYRSELKWANHKATGDLSYITPPIYLSFNSIESDRDEGVDIDSIINILHAGNASARIQTLFLGLDPSNFGPIYWHGTVIRQIYESLRKLQEVTTLHGELRLLDPFLQCKVKQKPPIALPSLHTLIIKFEQEPKKRLGKNILQPVYNFIHSRAITRHPIRRLVLERSPEFVHFSDKGIQLFREKFKNAVVVEYICSLP